MFRGVLNGVLIGSLVYLSDGIDTISWNHMLFYFGVKIFQLKDYGHIYLPEKKYTPPPSPTTKNWIAWVYNV